MAVIVHRRLPPVIRWFPVGCARSGAQGAGIGERHQKMHLVDRMTHVRPWSGVAGLERRIRRHGQAVVMAYERGERERAMAHLHALRACVAARPLDHVRAMELARGLA